MDKHRESKTFKADGTRPIETGKLEIVDTFSEDGIRPIAKSSNYLISNQTKESNDLENSESKTPLTTNRDSKVNKLLNIDNDASGDSEQVKIDHQRPVNNSSLKIVDTFYEDGTRPIMANKYQVVDTLNIDGERPITSQQ